MMDEFTSPRGMAAAWDRASAEYLARRDERIDTVTYGALAPDESRLHLLGGIRDRRVLDFGCGGGHNAIACARAGAAVTGIDISGVQLAAAAQLARRAKVSVAWRQGGVEQLAEAGPAELILAIHVLSYIAQVEGALAGCCAALAEGGEVLVAVDHPIRNCFWDEEVEDLGPVAVRRYDDDATVTWRFDAATPMQSFPRTTAAWIDAAAAGGLRLARMVEPLAPRELCDRLWPEDSPLAPLRELPHTLIMLFVAA